MIYLYSDTDFVYFLLGFALLLVVLIPIVGFLFKPIIQKKIPLIIADTLEKYQLTLIEVIHPKLLDIGPFENGEKELKTVNTMADIMGLYPDFTTYRKLLVETKNGTPATYWIKISFDILTLKNVELKITSK